jgi:hypothetical protein
VGVCVTRRSNRPGTCPDRPGHCPGARRVWHVFLQSWDTADRAIERSRYKFYKWLKISHGSRTLVNEHMRSIALQVVRKPENGHDILKHNYVQMRALTAVASAKAGVRVHKPLRNCHVSRHKSKNRDKQITTTDRVRCRYFPCRISIAFSRYSSLP